MKKINEYLDDLKEKTGSDNKSAELMKIDRSAISNIRKRGLISDETAIKIAELLSVETSELLIAAAMARSNEGVKMEWEKVAKRLGIAACFLLSVCFTSDIVLSSFDNNIHYAKLIRRKKQVRILLRAWFLALESKLCQKQNVILANAQAFITYVKRLSLIPKQPLTC